MYNVHFSWTAEPLHVRLFVVYLLLLSCVMAVLILKLVRRFFPLPGRKISLKHIREGAVDPDLLAESALANNLACDIPLNSGAPSLVASKEATVRLMRLADFKFQYLWEGCRDDVALIRRLALLTLLLSLLIIVYGTFPTWGDEFNNASITGYVALFRTVSQLLERLALGLAASVILYAISICFERVAMHRRTLWTYFRSRCEAEIAGE